MGGCGGDAVVRVLNATTVTLDTLHCPCVVVLDMGGTGENFSVGEVGVVTRIMGTRTTGWALCDAVTCPAGVMVHGGEFDVEGIGLLVCMLQMIQKMDGMEDVGVGCPGLLTMPGEENIRMVLCTDVGFFM